MNRIEQAVAAGVTFVCATCDHYWWGVEKGISECRAGFEDKTCCGPMGRKAYPEYKGPLGENLHAFCFICGHTADAAVEVMGEGFVGVCKAHVETVGNFSRPGEKPPFVTEQKLPVVE